MPKVHMIALKDMPYRGHTVKGGTNFFADGSYDANLLTKLGRAVESPVPAPAQPAPSNPGYFRRDMQAAGLATPAAKKTPAARKTSAALVRRKDDEPEGTA